MSDTRCGFVALIGEPNAGKSTLMNLMVGAKIAIVTHKVQTTRARIRGIALEDKTQIIFVDTPGLFRTRRNLDKAMVAAAWAATSDADITVLLVEAHRGLTPGVQMILDGLNDRAGPKARILLAINKIDKVKSQVLLELTQKLNDAFAFEQTFMISAEKGHGVADLKAHLAKELPEGPWHYPEDQIADVPMRMIAAEVTREKLMLRLHQELPYFLTVETENWEQRKDGSVRIDQMIYVTREGHKGITLGPKGQTIKSVSMAARQELKEMVGTEVHLFLQVKVRPQWETEAERFTEMGLDFSDTKK
ncbi:MAG: GTPase Era [Rhodobacteraceae bacterium]|nr:GTPase Era [Paracoccaceae bacterium]